MYHKKVYQIVFYDSLNTTATEDMSTAGYDGLLQGV